MSKVIIGVVVLGVLGGLALLTMQEEQSKPAPPPAVVSGPPAGASFVAEPPESIVRSVGATKKERRADAVGEYVDLWVPGEGWEGEVVEVSASGVKLRRLSNSTIGGEVTILARMASRPETAVGKTVRVQGRITNVQVRAAVASVVNVIELADARLVTGG